MPSTDRWEGVNWINLAEERNKNLAPVNTVIKRRVPYNAEMP
jgi:hypothetical protein